MPAKEIANEDWDSSRQSGGIWTPASHDAITWITITASKAKASNKYILVNNISWVVPSGCSLSGYTFISGGSVSPIMATSTKCKCDSQYVMRKDDQGSCMGGFVLTAPPNTPLTCSCTFKINDAGQTKVKSE